MSTCFIVYPIRSDPIKQFYPILYRAVFLLLLFTLIAVTIPVKAGAKKNIFNPKNKRLIVLDPGHGGYDKGAQGAAGTFEKTIALTLAQLIVDELENEFEMILTRTDDYGLDIPSRINLTHHHKAELFISLHTGGSFLHQTNGIDIFYFERMSQYAIDYEETPHSTNSRFLAELIQKRFFEGEKKSKVQLRGAPLLILEGLDMPAILIEVGHLTHPAEEKKLTDKEFLADLAKKISQGIIDFFQKINE
ncbi:MAG: N-acetylmuramoyl-L-alanine amidase [Desulfobacterales bacterium]|nr:N-acetylmuramoyl-L-alanine amidase [Desulfobacterales bacterium]